ncbi:triose-phosphate isomerase [Acuticoccus sediminis]|uniref:Triosephosphate isomerase n=1 Tax=Acuticoccus sediminis TaxID=2184697 RepID=A0A8B2P6H1_9HYPH|nr:triose-phosphate isomerase [Acuticoccus sediminis]RAI04169.1 triose-phosphate isomerase [Acuticoccus sediminis]
MLIAGNWKMNGTPDSMDEFGRMIARAPEATARGIDLLVCPPAILISKFADRATVSKIAIGGQDCHPEEKGAHTGDISAEMLASCGASAVIVGHSERRADHGETDELVAAKAAAAQRAGLTAIVCVGETEAQRDAGETEAVVGGQLDGSVPASLDPSRLVVAYEPVWAIGTGRTPSVEDVAAVHKAIRDRLEARFSTHVPILYGGSVKPSNAAELLAVENVDGALVGGASLKADDFIGIALAAPKAA